MKGLTLLVFTIILNACEKAPFVDEYYRIIVINNSAEEVYVHRAGVHASKHYPDTTLPESKPALLKIPAQNRSYFDSKTKWDERIKGLPADTLSVFFISGNVYENESWEKIKNEYIILERDDLSVSDLEATNYTITYQ